MTFRLGRLVPPPLRPLAALVRGPAARRHRARADLSVAWNTASRN